MPRSITPAAALLLLAAACRPQAPSARSPDTSRTAAVTSAQEGPDAPGRHGGFHCEHGISRGALTACATGNGQRHIL